MINLKPADGWLLIFMLTPGTQLWLPRNDYLNPTGTVRPSPGASNLDKLKN